MHNLNVDHLKSASSISQQLYSAVTRLAAVFAQAALPCKLPSLNRSMPPLPSPPSKVSKMQIRVDPLVYSLCAE
jgi:hypothetical protein